MPSEDEIFYAGFLAVLDVIYAYDAESIAEEALGTVDTKALLKWARKDEYHNLNKLLETAKTNRYRGKDFTTKSSYTLVMAKKSAGGIKKGGSAKPGSSKISGKAKVANKGMVLSPAVMK